jgi:hypothetical protein
MSSDGQYQVVGINSGTAYYSSNFGSTWTLSTPSGSLVWQSLAMSANGQYVVAGIFETAILVSSNYGQSYATIVSSLDRFLNTAISSTGQYQVVSTGIGSSGQGRIYYSSNFGASFTSSTSFTYRQWRGICMSSDGQTVYAAISGGQIYKSTNNGQTFSVLGSSPTIGWINGSTSLTGQYVIFSSNTTIYYSSNYGEIWTAIASPTTSLIWNSVAISKDALRAIAVVYGGLAYYANATVV